MKVSVALFLFALGIGPSAQASNLIQYFPYHKSIGSGASCNGIYGKVTGLSTTWDTPFLEVVGNLEGPDSLQTPVGTLHRRPKISLPEEGDGYLRSAGGIIIGIAAPEPGDPLAAFATIAKGCEKHSVWGLAYGLQTDPLHLFLGDVEWLNQHLILRKGTLYDVPFTFEQWQGEGDPTPIESIRSLANAKILLPRALTSEDQGRQFLGTLAVPPAIFGQIKKKAEFLIYLLDAKALVTKTGESPVNGQISSLYTKWVEGTRALGLYLNGELSSILPSLHSLNGTPPPNLPISIPAETALKIAERLQHHWEAMTDAPTLALDLQTAAAPYFAEPLSNDAVAEALTHLDAKLKGKP